jgi:hypothetical protein
MKRTSLPLVKPIVDFIAEAKYELVPGVHHGEDGDDFY